MINCIGEKLSALEGSKNLTSLVGPGDGSRAICDAHDRFGIGDFHHYRLFCGLSFIKNFPCAGHCFAGRDLGCSVQNISMMEFS